MPPRGDAEPRVPRRRPGEELNQILAEEGKRAPANRAERGAERGTIGPGQGQPQTQTPTTTQPASGGGGGGGGVPPPPPPPSGGGGGGGGGRPAGAAAGDDEGADVDALIRSNIKDRLSGKTTRFTPEILSMMKQKLFEETQGQIRRAQARVRSDAIRRGIYRSGVTSSAIKDVENEGTRAYSSGIRDILLQKAMTEYDDRIKAIDSAQQWLNGLRQYNIGNRQIQATLQAAEIQASASRYAADRGLEGARAAAGASRAAANQAHARWEAGLVSYGPEGNKQMVPADVAIALDQLGGTATPVGYKG